MAQDRRVARTKAALTRALFELLGEKGHEKITITELAQRADVDRKTFYLHYHSVEEILEDFYEDALCRLQADLEREKVFGREIDMAGFFRALSGVMAKDMPLYRRLAAGSGYTYFMERLRTLLKSAMEDALRRKGEEDEIQLRMSAEVYAAGVMRAYREWLNGSLDLDQEDFASRIGRMVCQGLGL